MARDELEINLTAVDNASDTMDKVADKAEAIENADAEVTVTATDQASDELADIRSKLTALDDDTAEVFLKAEKRDAKRDISAIQRELIALDGDDATVLVDAKGDAERRLAAIDAELDSLDGRTADVSVEGLDSASELLDAMPGQVGDIGGALTGPAGPVAGVAALGAGLFAVAKQQTDLALEAKTFADLTGSSVDFASRLGTVAGQAGIEFNDLSDMALQVADAMSSNADYAERLGINLDDGKNPAERLVQVMQLMNSPLIGANEKAEIFGKLLGEEGVRQGQRVISTVGDLGRAMDDLPSSAIVSDEDVEHALEFKESLDELQIAMQQLAAAAGEVVVPALTDIKTGVDEVIDAAGGIENLTGVVGKLGDTTSDAGFEWSKTMGIFGIVGSETENLTGSFVEYNKVASDRAYWDRQGAEAAEKIAEADAEATEAAEAAAEANAEAAKAAEERADKVNDLIDKLDDLAGKNARLVGGTIAVENAQIRARQEAAAYAQVLTGVDEAGEALTLTEDEKTLALNSAIEAQISAAETAADYEVAQREATGRVVDATEQNAILADEYRTLAGELAPDSPLRSRLLGFADDLDAIPAEVATVATFEAPFDEVQAYAEMIAGVPNLKETTLRTIRENVSRDQRHQENRFGQSHTGSRFAAGEEKFVVPGQVFRPDVPGRMESVEESARSGTGGRSGPADNVRIVLNLNDTRQVEALIAAHDADLLEAFAGGVLD